MDTRLISTTDTHKAEDGAKIRIDGITDATDADDLLTAFGKWDQRCDAVRAQAILLDIDLLFLPSYSPNLNLIERYWKFVKKKCLYNRFHADFKSFCAVIDDGLNEKEKYAKELKTLMTLKFQTLENAQFLERIRKECGVLFFQSRSKQLPSPSGRGGEEGSFPAKQTPHSFRIRSKRVMYKTRAGR